MPDDTEPEGRQRIRPAAQQRPRTQYVKVRWHDLQELLRERDFLLHQASGKTKAALVVMQTRTSGGVPPNEGWPD